MRGLHTDDAARHTAGALLGLDVPDAVADQGRAGASTLPIGRVALQQFGSHADTDLAFTQPVTFIVGPNGHGKSTIVEGLLWALTGLFARGVDGRGVGAGAVVRTGQTAARVTVHTALAGDVLREVKHGKVRVIVDEQATTEVDPQAAIYTRMRTSGARLRTVFQGATLLDADHTTGKDLLLDVLQVRVTVGEHTYTLPQLDAAYEKAYEDRKLAKRDRDAIRVPAKPDQAAPDLPALEQKLAGLRDEEKSLIAQHAEAAGRRREITAKLEGLTRTRDEFQRAIERSAGVHDQLDRVEAQLQDLASVEPDGAIETAEAEEVATLQERLIDASGRVRLLQGAVGGIEQHSPSKGCVIDSAIPCKTPAKAFADALTKMRIDIAVLHEEIRTATPRIQELQSLAHGRQQAGGERRRRLASLEQERSRLQNLARDRQGDETRLAEVTAAIAAADQALAACGEIVADPHLDALRERIRKAEQEVIPHARTLVGRWATYESAKAQADALAVTVERLEQRVEQLGPKGARVGALAQALSAFTERINGDLARFGFSLAIELDPWVVSVNGRPAVRLSPSERFRVGACLQLAFAEYTGLHVAVIDNADVLVTPEARGGFNALALAWAQAAPGRQVIVVAAKEDAWRIPAIAGTAVYRVRQDEHGISRATLEVEHASAAA